MTLELRRRIIAARKALKEVDERLKTYQFQGAREWAMSAASLLDSVIADTREPERFEP